MALDPDPHGLVSVRRYPLIPGLAVAAALTALTILKLGVGANAIAWALVQCLLVALAVVDIASRRIPNVVTGPAVVVAIVLRVLFVRSALPEVLIAGAVAFVLFLVFALRTNGLGIGDVKLAGLLGVLLGEAVLPGLLVGTVIGGLVSLALVLRSREWLHRTIAYGPYLCLGGAIAIVAFGPPALV